MPRKKRKAGKPRSRAGMMPGEYKRRGTVYVERLRKADEPKRYGEDDLMTTDIYNVITRRFDGHWTHIVEVQGQQAVLPGKVVDQMIRHRDSVTTEQRRVSAQETHERLRAKADADQAEAERARDLQGL